MKPAIVVRPAEDAEATAARLRAAGLEAVVAPLFTLEPLAWRAPSGPFDALLIGSANALRLDGAGLAQWRDLPVLAVGERTARTAREAGFTVDAVGSGGLQALLDGLAAPRRLLRLAGETHVALNPPAGIGIVTVPVYAARPQPLPEDFPTAGVVLLHSGEAARHFAAEIGRAGRSRAAYTLACLAPRVAESAGAGWGECRIAGQVNEAAMVELARELCQQL